MSNDGAPFLIIPIFLKYFIVKILIRELEMYASKIPLFLVFQFELFQKFLGILSTKLVIFQMLRTLSHFIKAHHVCQRVTNTLNI